MLLAKNCSNLYVNPWLALLVWRCRPSRARRPPINLKIDTRVWHSQTTLCLITLLRSGCLKKFGLSLTSRDGRPDCVWQRSGASCPREARSSARIARIAHALGQTCQTLSGLPPRAGPWSLREAAKRPSVCHTMYGLPARAGPSLREGYVRFMWGSCEGGRVSWGNRAFCLAMQTLSRAPTSERYEARPDYVWQRARWIVYFRSPGISWTCFRIRLPNKTRQASGRKPRPLIHYSKTNLKILKKV